MEITGRIRGAYAIPHSGYSTIIYTGSIRVYICTSIYIYIYRRRYSHTGVPRAENFAIQRYTAECSIFIARALARRSYKIKFRYVSLRPSPPPLPAPHAPLSLVAFRLFSHQVCPEFRAFRQYSNQPRKLPTPDATLNVNLVRRLIRSCAPNLLNVRNPVALKMHVARRRRAARFVLRARLKF